MISFFVADLQRA